MYLMLGTRPDLSFAINYFSRFQDKATHELLVYLKRVLRYLKETMNLELIYQNHSKDQVLDCFVDSDWGGDISDRKSVSGYLFQVFGNTVSWSTRKQNCGALSSTEAKLISLCSSIQEGIWLEKLLADFQIRVNSVRVHEDNQGCINIIKNPSNNKRVKHMDIKYNYISDLWKKGRISLEYVESKKQLADILTKGLPRVHFCFLREKLGLV